MAPCGTPGVGGSLRDFSLVETFLQRVGLIIHTTLLSHTAFSSTISCWNLFQHLWLIFLPFKLNVFANESWRVFHSLFHTRITGCQKTGEKNEYLKKNRLEIISCEPVSVKCLVVNHENGNVKLGQSCEMFGMRGSCGALEMEDLGSVPAWHCSPARKST